MAQWGAPAAPASAFFWCARHGAERRSLLSEPGAEMRLMAAIVSRENMMTAYQRVMANKGAHRATPLN